MLKQLSLACLTVVVAGSVGLLAQQPEDDINVLVTPPLEVAAQRDTLPDLGLPGKKEEANPSPAPNAQECIVPICACNQPCCQCQERGGFFQRCRLFRRICAFLFGGDCCHDHAARS